MAITPNLHTGSLLTAQVKSINRRMCITNVQRFYSFRSIPIVVEYVSHTALQRRDVRVFLVAVGAAVVVMLLSVV